MYISQKLQIAVCIGRDYTSDYWKLVSPCPSIYNYRLLTGPFSGYNNASRSCKMESPSMYLLTISHLFELQFAAEQARCDLGEEKFLLGLRYIDGDIRFEDGTSVEAVKSLYNFSDEVMGPNTCFSVGTEEGMNKLC
ncbi:unnamed protein product [Enterobius vermicularis]|uniref:NTR domain-containing protein n=1 Tax=Enterobius vermicularis TaxID=51028 RepID=A0A0N4V0I3_ENTVE|nr:unnamed protein product [Enterobius vermicularis]